MNRRILLVTGDAGESYETLYAVHRFREAGDAVGRIAAFLRAAVPASVHNPCGSGPAAGEQFRDGACDSSSRGRRHAASIRLPARHHPDDAVNRAADFRRGRLAIGFPLALGYGYSYSVSAEQFQP